jgi:hypothetical protein
MTAMTDRFVSHFMPLLFPKTAIDIRLGIHVFGAKFKLKKKKLLRLI